MTLEHKRALRLGVALCLLALTIFLYGHASAAAIPLSFLTVFVAITVPVRHTP
jgi:multisubunit Na+/H+ antiporter MnhG subunit